jgi:signal transduction histidine kinase
LNLRFDERLAERMRIAQELHDTLLQGVISASMQLHLAVDMVPENSAARVLLGSVLQLMGQVTEEGRTTLRGIRSAGSERHDLERAFSSVPEDLALGADAAYRVVVDGLARPLHPAVRDEVYRIGREALVNAFRHAQATSIELQMEYTPGHLRVVVRDNGCGIDPEVLITGREGHWGMAGMRERAKAIGGKFRVFSRPTAGTEVELTVPAHVAFQQLTRNRLWQGFRSLVSNAGIQRPRGDRNL